MSEDTLDDLHDCLIFLNKIEGFNELNDNEQEISSKAYDIIKHLYNRYIV